MASRSASVIIVCEDTQQEVFIRYWLENKGLNPRKLRVVKHSLGQGSGEQFVRDRYPIEVGEMRRVGTHRPIGLSLAIMIDADTATVQDRHEALNATLVQAGQPLRESTEKIAILVPKRNIETWIHYLQGTDVNETDSYRKLNKPSDCKEDVIHFVATRDDSILKTSAPDSLKLALVEMIRIT